MSIVVGYKAFFYCEMLLRNIAKKSFQSRMKKHDKALNVFDLINFVVSWQNADITIFYQIDFGSFKNLLRYYLCRFEHNFPFGNFA